MSFYGTTIPVTRDEATTPDNPVKIYSFGWTSPAGRIRHSGQFHRTLESAILAASRHRDRHAPRGFADYHVVGRAIAGFAF